MALGFGALSFALAFWQRPGWATSDTKIDLHVDPVTFVGDVASVWTPSIDLGAVQGAQYAGYLWPVGPLFAVLDLIGLSPWVAHRIWLGLMFALSAWGMLKLLDLVLGRPRGVPHLLGAAFYVLNPYTVIFTGRTSITLLGYAVLPWLLVVVHHGVRAVASARPWRGWPGWWWAAAFALVLTSIGGGNNAAVVGWMLVGPLVLLVYEPLVGSVRWRDAAGFLVRVGILGTLASLWWILPLVVHVGYGIDFLQFTEQPRSIWGTNSASEALRLMAHWTSYIGVGFYGATYPFFSEAGALLFDPLVVVASLLLPAMAVGGVVWTRRRPYAPFLLLLLLVGLVIVVAGFPNGTPARDGLEWVYRNVPLVRFMRTTQKAAPLIAVGVGGLLALAVQVALARLRELRDERRRRLGLVALPACLAALILLAALPLVRGTAVDEQLAWKQIPDAWTEAGADLDRELPRNTRAVVLPGQIFANYTWGGTVDAILPRVTERPVAIRYETPYSDPHATDLLWTVDRLVQQRRLLPGQLEPLLKLMGAAAVVTGSDDDPTRSGAVNAAAAAAELAGQGMSDPTRAYGPVRPVRPPPGELTGSVPLPQVRRYDVPEGRGMVGVEPVAPTTVVDGAAAGLAGLAAFGELPRHGPILYAGDLEAAELRRIAAAGGEVVVSDSNRRRRFVPEFGHQNVGATLAETEELADDFAFIDPFFDRGSDAQTVALLRGARHLRAPSAGGLLEFPEYSAFAAFDGDPSTVWAADRYLHPRERWIEVGFERPRDVPYVDLLPVRDWRGIEREVDVNGVRAELRPGLNRIRLGLRDVGSLRVTITKVDQPGGDLRGNGGFREIRIPGVRLERPLRPPVLAARALAGRDLRRVGLTYLFERTTADRPFRLDRQTGSPLLELAANRRDAEKQLDRLVFAPAGRSYEVDAWVYPDIEAGDSELDRLSGVRGRVTFESSGRFHNEPRHRASSAFDGRSGSAWVGIWARPSAPHPWISWTTQRPLTVRSLRLVPAAPPARVPSTVRLSWPGGASPALPVGGGGEVALPRPARAGRFRVTVLETRPARGPERPARATRAVGIASLEVPGLRPVRVPRDGPLRARCGSASIEVGGRAVPLRPRGTVADVEAGRPLRAAACAGEVAMGAGLQRIESLPATFSVHLLRMRSPAPDGVPAPTGGGRLLDSGSLGGSSVDGVRVALDGPAWLVLGQSYNEGWRASCDGRALGEPRPINGYANGWRAPADCRAAAFEYQPQDGVRLGQVVSGIVCLLLLAFLAVGWLLARGRPGATPPAETPGPAERARRLPLPRAALVAAVATVPLALLFAARSSVVILPLLTLVLWRGAGAGLLAGIAAVLLGFVVPVLYLVLTPENRGGYNFEYSAELIWAHWVAVGAVVLLMVACWRLVASRSR
jgi:arabinofuranan 3-O-arabinosyltransferase